MAKKVKESGAAAESKVKPAPRKRAKATLASLRMLEDMRQMFQKQRIAMDNRLRADEQGRSEAVDVELVQQYADLFFEQEQAALALIGQAVLQHEMWPWLRSIKGIGPALGGQLLASVDIEKCDTVSALWAYCGMGVSDGKADRPVKGQPLRYNAHLKRTCFLIAASFLRASSPYRKEYDEAKAKYERTRPEWTAAHRDMAARRKMVKLFISHFWEAWRTLRGLPVRPAYAMAVLGHDGFKEPAEYLSKPVREVDYEFIDARVLGEEG